MVIQELEQQQQRKSVQPPPPPPPVSRKHPPQALRPVHVQEAIRRLEQSQLTLPVAMLWVSVHS